MSCARARARERERERERESERVNPDFIIAVNDFWDNLNPAMADRFFTSALRLNPLAYDRRSLMNRSTFNGIAHACARARARRTRNVSRKFVRLIAVTQY